MEHETKLSKAGWCKTWQNKSSVMPSSWSSIGMFSSTWGQNNDYSFWVSYLVFHINKFMTVLSLFLDVYLSVLYLMCVFTLFCVKGPLLPIKQVFTLFLSDLWNILLIEYGILWSRFNHFFPLEQCLWPLVSPWKYLTQMLCVDFTQISSRYFAKY